MITVLTALHDLVHSGQFSAQRHRRRGKKRKDGRKKRMNRRIGRGENNEGQKDK